MSYFNDHYVEFQEDLSKAYLRAVCARQGILFHDLSDRDKNGIDANLELVKDDGSIEIKVQIKSSKNMTYNDEGKIIYDVDATLHNKLCDNKFRITVIVLLIVDEDSSKWSILNEDELVIKYKMFYYEYLNEEITDNSSSKRILIDVNNIVDPSNFYDKCVEIHENWENRI